MVKRGKLSRSWGRSPRRTAFAFCILAALAGSSISSCGPHIPAERPLTGIENSERVLSASSPVEVIEAVDRPTLQLIRRLGDPLGAVGVAVFPPRGSLDTVPLAALLQKRLIELDESSNLKIHATGLAVLVLVEVASEDDGESELKAIYQALNEEVSQQEAEQLKAESYLQVAAQRAGKASPVGLCLGELGAEGQRVIADAGPDSEKDSRQWLEQIRKSSVTAARVGLSAVGHESLLNKLSVIHDWKWQAGEAIRDLWDSATAMSVVDGKGGRGIRVALRVADSERSLAAAREIRDPDHPLHARLAGFSSTLSVEQVDVSLRPAGACLALSLSIEESRGAPSEEFIAKAALMTAHELSGAVEQSLTEDERSLALLEPQTAAEAAALAAWTAVRSPVTGAGAKRIIEYQKAQSETSSASTLLRTVEKVEAKWAAHSIPVAVREETGQGQLWMMLASPCAMAPESNEDSGLRALALASLAQDMSGKRGVQLQPWISHLGAGLVAHASPLRGETPEEHAVRLARALGAAFVGAGVDGRSVAQARSEQLARIGSDPGVALLTSVLGGQHISLIQPYGSENTVASLSTSDVERARSELAQEPLRLAVLASSTVEQAKLAQEALSGWLASVVDKPRPCPTIQVEAAKPGMWKIQTLDQDVFVGAYVGIWSEVRPEVGFALTHFLNGAQGPFAGLGSEDSPLLRAEAHWAPSASGGALSVTVGGLPDQRAAAIEEVRLRLRELSRTGLSTAQVKSLAEEYSRRQLAVKKRPGGRLVDLWAGGDFSPPKAQEFAAITAALAEDQHRIVVVEQRK